MPSAETLAEQPGEDPHAWGEFFDTHYDRLTRGVARLMGSDQQEVADVIQDTFLEAARSAAQFDRTRGTAWVWLWGIARNRVALHYRRSKRDQRHLDGKPVLGGRATEFVEWLEGGECDPPDAAMANELADMIRDTLLQLPNDYCQLLMQAYLDSTPIRDVAAAASLSESATRSKLARARRAFRDVFVQRYGAPSDSASADQTQSS